MMYYTVDLMKRMRSEGVGDKDIIRSCVTMIFDRLSAAGDDSGALLDATTLIMALREAREFVQDREAYTMADEVLYILTNGAPDDLTKWMRKTRGPPGGLR